MPITRQAVLRLPLAVERLAKLGDEPAMHEIECKVARHIGELCHAFDHFGERCLAADVAHHEGRHDALAELAQHALEADFVQRGRNLQKIAHQSAVKGMVGMLAQPVDDLRACLKQMAQVTAVR